MTIPDIGPTTTGGDARARINAAKAVAEAAEVAGVAAALLAAHEGAANPHPGYLTAAEGAAAYDAIGAAAAAYAAAVAASQPLNAGLTAISLLATAGFGRGLLTLADAAALKALTTYTKTDVGLGNVDNTSDAAKPVSTATQTALDLKANASALSGYQPLAAFLTALGALAGYTALKTALSLVKADVGLGNVDNTADSAKPVSTAQQAALDVKANIADTLNTQTGTSYTLQASDSGKVVELNNASAITVTVPNSLPAGFNCILAQIGAGQVTVQAGSGATLNAYPSGGVKTPGQWGETSLRIRANSGGSAAVAVMGGGVA